MIQVHQRLHLDKSLYSNSYNFQKYYLICFTILLDFTLAIVHNSVYIFLFAEYIFFRAPKVFTSQ